MTLLCPGWCGEQFTNPDLVKNQKDLQRHIHRCVKGHATVTLLGRYSIWLLQNGLLDGPDNARQLYVEHLAARFVEDAPPTDPRATGDRK